MLLNLLGQLSLLAFNFLLFFDESLNFVVTILHLITLVLELTLQGHDGFVLADLIRQRVAQPCHLVLKLGILALLNGNLFFELPQGRVTDESILEALRV